MSNSAQNKSGVSIKEKRQRTMYYRKAVFPKMLDLQSQTAPPKSTLEELLIDALEMLKSNNESAARPLDFSYTELMETTDGGLSLASYPNIGYTGIIYRTREGDRVPASKGGTAQATIVSAQPIDDDNQPVPPAKYIIYFAIRGNHLVYFADFNNADTRLQDFLFWLISTKTKKLSSLYRLELIATFTDNVRKRITEQGVKQIKFNSKTEVGVVDGWTDLIKSAFFSGGTRQSHIVSTTEEQQAALNACEFILHIRTGSKDKGIKQEALANYCSRLSDEQLNQLSFELGDDTKIEQGEVTRTHKAYIEYENGVAMEYSARRALSSWLTQIVQDATID